MQCCNHNENEHNHGKAQRKSQGHSPLGHALMMALCCGLPIVLIWMLPSIISVFPAAAGLGAVIPFLCPIMMFLMMFMMFKGKGHSHDDCEKGKAAAAENPDKE